MALASLLILAFVGASSAFQNGVTSTRNTSLLVTYPSVIQVETVSLTGWAVWTQTCVGSILNNMNILTAASCVSEPYYNLADIRIRAGANNRNTGGFIHNVQVVIPSPTFSVSNVTTWRDDIAVVRLTSSLIYSNIINQATIAAPGSVIPAGITLNQLGWENTNSSALSQVSILTIALSNCGLAANNSDSLCSASSNLLNNASPGSPLLYEGINVGLISGVNFVNNSTASLVSANIPAYTAWIISVVV